MTADAKAYAAQQSAGDHAEIRRLQQRNIELIEEAENAQQRVAALLAKLEATGKVDAAGTWHEEGCRGCVYDQTLCGVVRAALQEP